MPLAEETITARYSIRAYDKGQVTINNSVHSDSLILCADRIISPWPVTSIEQLSLEHLEPVFELKPDVILLGSGDRQVFPDIGILGHFAQRGHGVEVMDTGALCRTFNILVAEDRHVVAAIILAED